MSSLFVDEDEDEYRDSTSLFVPDEVNHIESPEALDAPVVVDAFTSLQETKESSNNDIVQHESEPQVSSNVGISCNLPLKFQHLIVEDMLSRDGLLILGRGLGWEPLTANLLHVLSAPTPSKRSLLILLNARDDENSKIGEELNELDWIDTDIYSKSDGPPPFVVISNELSTADKRARIYEKGGIISLTSRVLVVDLLSGVLSPNDITGLFMLHAEKITEKSNESFIVNLYRDGNEWGFIKAVTDDPESFYGFTPLASKLKNLRISNVFLWPRFHVEVSSSLSLQDRNLSRRQREEQDQRRYVTEINVKMTFKMNKIQAAILSCIQACVGELKRHNPSLATEYWDIENVHDNEFVPRIRSALDPQWHRISWTSKQLIYDLSTLKGLMSSLITLDSVTFYQIVQGILDHNIKASAGGRKFVGSPWLNLDEATTIISYAKERAVAIMRKTKRRKIENDPEKEYEEYEEEEYLLEEQPKWDQLGILLDDIMHEKQYKDRNYEGPIVIMCSSSKTLNQLKEFISTMTKEENNITGKRRFSGRKFMANKLRGYLTYKDLSILTKKLSLELDDSENKLNGQEPEEELNTSKTFTRGKGNIQSKRRRTRGAAAVANVHRLHSLTDDGKYTEAAEIDPSIMGRLEQDDEDDSNGEDEDLKVDEDIGGGGFIEDDIQEINETEFTTAKFQFNHIDRSDQIILENYNERTNDSLLQELSPSYIIMYEPDLAFIRRVEIYQATNKESPAKAYFMYYGNSVEEQKHLLRIKKEKEAFTRLIREKASLSKHFETIDDNNKFQIRRQEVANTRIAGGSNFRDPNDELRVVVDVREFRSALPNLLYRIGVKVVPCMITVGDYIISPKICIERKAIPDLIQSFKSGRLYNQCEQMFRYYEFPTLLIEFDENKSFSFEPFSETRAFGGAATSGAKSALAATKFLQQDIQSKIIMLLVTFPKLKIIWSSSPYETAQILLSLKSNQEEPNVGEAIAKGVNSNILTTSQSPPVYNEDSIDLIKNIPGINDNNYFQIISRVKSIEDLVDISQQTLIEILGDENGRKAYEFMHRIVT
ncbi:DNA repair protein Rad1p [[Candida] anglica]|uniref:DNA repair protein Rad1p n=1 Tax=[Candida] anglica TaxID=148631 RepID=A0ABP0EKM9_9ASCO